MILYSTTKSLLCFPTNIAHYRLGINYYSYYHDNFPFPMNAVTMKVVALQSYIEYSVVNIIIPSNAHTIQVIQHCLAEEI